MLITPAFNQKTTSVLKLLASLLVNIDCFFFCFQSPVLSYNVLHVSGCPCRHQQFAGKHQCFLFSHHSELCHICFTQIHFNKLWGKDMVYEVVLFEKLSRINSYLIVLCPCLFPTNKLVQCWAVINKTSLASPVALISHLVTLCVNCFSYAQPSSLITSHAQLQ